MIIDSLERMEEIVASRKFLQWDGWDVVQSFPSEKGRTSKFGIRKNGRWFIQKRYPITEKGWDVPSKFLSDKRDRSESK